MSHLLIGVDGGATSCRARLCDIEGSFLGEGLSGPANIHLDLGGSLRSIQAACERAFEAAGLNPLNVYHAHAGLGLAGAGIGAAYERARANLGSFASIVVDTDAYIAWLGAHQGKDGAIVILGTGSCGLAVVNGRRIAVGGWGPEVSDEAGGQRMGREALRRTLWAFDGRAEKTDLSDRILDRFEWDPARIVCFTSKATPADYAEFAPLILEYASAKDPLAVAIVKEAAEAAACIIDRLVDVGAPTVALMGGLATPLAPWLPHRVRGYLSEAKSDPLDGAILMARQTFFKTHSIRSLAS
jgi:glucosamine kinase